MRRTLIYVLIFSIILQFLLLPVSRSVASDSPHLATSDGSYFIELDDDSESSNLVLKVDDAIDEAFYDEADFHTISAVIKHYLFFSLQKFFPASPLRGPPLLG